MKRCKLLGSLFIFLIMFNGCSNEQLTSLLDYYENGNIKKHYYVDVYKRIQGAYLEYHPNKKISKIIYFVDGSKNGPYERFDEEGNIKIFHTYLNDTLNGRCYSFYADGIVKEFSNYKNGKRFGLNIEYYENSTNSIKTWGVFMNDHAIHEAILYYENRNIQQYQYRNSSGEKVFIKLYDQNGKFVSQSGHHIVEVHAKNASSLKLGDTLRIRSFIVNPVDEQNDILIEEIKDGKIRKLLQARITYYFTDYLMPANELGSHNIKISVIEKATGKTLDEYKFIARVSTN